MFKKSSIIHIITTVYKPSAVSGQFQTHCILQKKSPIATDTNNSAQTLIYVLMHLTCWPTHRQEPVHGQECPVGFPPQRQGPCPPC
jgi:hypothetical protein